MKFKKPKKIKSLTKTFKFRIYPTKSQVIKLEYTLDLCRELYNAALQERREAYNQSLSKRFGISKVSITYRQQQDQLPEIKEFRPDLKDVYSTVLQNVLNRLDESFQGFFKRIKKKQKVGYPRFKSKNSYDSFTFVQTGFNLRGGKLQLSKLGHFKVKQHRDIEGTIKTCQIKRVNEKWFACFGCEVIANPQPKTNKVVGIDLGLTTFATFDSGDKIKNPKFFKKFKDKLAKANRQFSACQKGTPKRRSKLKVLRKIYEKISNSRSNFAHQESRKLVNSFDVICLEDLKIKRILEEKKYSNSISDVAWSQFINFVSYKAEYAGKKTILVNPKNTSQNCSLCGVKVEKDITVRIHDCPNCGLKMCRDQNAACNILSLGLQTLRNQTLEAPTKSCLVGE